jgi:hypothetical protein
MPEIASISRNGCLGFANPRKLCTIFIRQVRGRAVRFLVEGGEKTIHPPNNPCLGMLGSRFDSTANTQSWAAQPQASCTRTGLCRRAQSAGL